MPDTIYSSVPIVIQIKNMNIGTEAHFGSVRIGICINP